MFLEPWEGIVFEAFSKYAQFDGRARRREFWLFLLAYLIAFVVLAVIDLGLGGTGDVVDDLGQGGSRSEELVALAYLLVTAAFLVPSIAVQARRLHDINRTGWWTLLGLIPFFGAVALMCFSVVRGTVGENRFGPDPKAATPPASP